MLTETAPNFMFQQHRNCYWLNKVNKALCGHICTLKPASASSALLSCERPRTHKLARKASGKSATGSCRQNSGESAGEPLPCLAGSKRTDRHGQGQVASIGTTGQCNACQCQDLGRIFFCSGTMQELSGDALASSTPASAPTALKPRSWINSLVISAWQAKIVRVDSQLGRSTPYIDAHTIVICSPARMS